MSYTTLTNFHTQNRKMVIHKIENWHTQHRRIVVFGLTSNEVTHTYVDLAACPHFTNEMQINLFRCLLFVATYVSITKKDTVLPH